MTPSRRGQGATVGGLGFALTLVVGLVPVAFLGWARDAGSLGRLSALGLWVMAALVTAIAVWAGVVLYRQAVDAHAPPADLWVASFLALATWWVGVLTLVPGLVFLRLTDDRSLDQYGARFFFEWALVYVLIAAAAFALGRWSMRSRAQEPQSPSVEVAI
jgi:cobalamin synthase